MLSAFAQRLATAGVCGCGVLYRSLAGSIVPGMPLTRPVGTACAAFPISPGCFELIRIGLAAGSCGNEGCLDPIVIAAGAVTGWARSACETEGGPILGAGAL